MAYYIAIRDVLNSKGNVRGLTSSVWNVSKKENQEYREEPFREYSRNLEIYQAKSYVEARTLAEKAMTVKEKHLELNEWSTYVYASLFNQPL